MYAVAIDGPAGAGKSTVARMAAQKLGYIYVDTGALYRAVGLYMVQHGINLETEEDVAAVLPQVKVELGFCVDGQHVYLCGKDVSRDIRTPQISMAASRVSAIGAVRDFLFHLQKEMAEKNNVLMDGRDIGTVVLPNAQVKIFLTASAQERAKRRCRELEEKGQQVSYQDILEDIQKRDYQDSHRAIAPLVPAEDAVILDTTNYTLQQSVEKLLEIVKERIN